MKRLGNEEWSGTCQALVLLVCVCVVVSLVSFLIMLVEEGQCGLHYHSGARPICQTLHTMPSCVITPCTSKCRVIVPFSERETESQFLKLRESSQIQRMKT